MRQLLSFIAIFIFCISINYAQITSPYTTIQDPHDPFNTTDSLMQDSLNMMDSMNLDWVEEEVDIYKYKRNSQKRIQLDTSLFALLDEVSSENFLWANLGNFNTSGYSLLFKTTDFEGKRGDRPHLFQAYSKEKQRNFFYHTNLPYSEFIFNAIGQNQQGVSVLHTQNITPEWNFSFDIGGNSSEGEYNRQKAQNFHGILNSHYKSANQKFNSYFSVFFEQFLQNENGGIISYDYLHNPQFTDRQRIPTQVGELAGGQVEVSSIHNRHRNFILDWTNNYSLGVVDSLYNEDSTDLKLRYTPRLIFEHNITWRNYQYLYNDKRPVAAFYEDVISFGQLSFNDSIYSKNNWQSLDNRFSLAGNLGKGSKQWQFKAGIGLKNQFYKQYSDIDENSLHKLWGTYAFGRIAKEALEENQWDINMDAQLFFTGEEAGNFHIKGALSKGLANWAKIDLYASQSLKSAAWYQQNRVFNSFSLENPSLQEEAITHLGGKLYIPKIKLTAFTDQYLVNNLISLQEDWTYKNLENPIYISQIGIEHKLNLGIFYALSKGIYQELSDTEQINLPRFLINEKLGIEAYIFKKALLINTGLEGIWYSPFKRSEYIPLLNDFIYHSSEKTVNMPILNFYLEFKVKGFRGFARVQQIQQLWTENNSYANFYPYRNTYFIFGFNWRLLQ